MTKQPSYRFEGYIESWEQKKLGEVGDFSIKTNSFSREKLCLNSGNVKNIHYGDILVKYNSTLNFENNSIPYIIDNDTKLTSDMFLKNGDIIFSDAAEDYSVGKCVELFNVSGDIVSGLHTIVCRPQIDFARYFLGYYLNSNSYRQQVLPMVQGAKVSSISKGNLSKTNISFPSLPEQTAIGSFFQDIDQLISLQQRKLEVLKEQKKTNLKLLFPAKGQTKPALRFSGFEDDWKEVKLGEIAELKRGLTYKPTSVVENGIRVLRSSNIDGDVFKKQEDDVFVEDSSVTIPYVQFGDILITAANGSSKLVGKHAIIEDSEKMVHGGFMLLARSKQYKFLNALLSSEWYSRFINVSVAGGNGAIGNLSKSNLEKEIVLCPIIPEQETIGSFFQDLDKSIAKQEEKVNQLKESKQTLLRKMFI